jgi:hypothetical protein
MKKKFTLAIGLGITFLSLNSFLSGPGANGYDCTGAESGLGNPTGCGLTSGCHSMGADAGIDVAIRVDSATTLNVQQFKPGKTYTVHITAVNRTGSALPKYGFQLGVTKGPRTTPTPANAGQLQTTGLSSDVQYSVGNPGTHIVNLIEHATTLTADSASGVYPVYSRSFTWKAPTDSADTVSFWAVFNGVNGDGLANSADRWDTAHVILTRLPVPAGVDEESGVISLSAFPNPVLNTINIRLANAKAGVYSVRVYDMLGRVVATVNVDVNAANTTIALNAVNWLPGTYNAVIEKEGIREVVQLVKR